MSAPYTDIGADSADIYNPVVKVYIIKNSRFFLIDIQFPNSKIRRKAFSGSNFAVH